MANNQVLGPYDQWSMVVLYDPKTGNVAHTHQAVTTRGGTHPDPDTLEKLAADHATRAEDRLSRRHGFSPRGSESNQFRRTLYCRSQEQVSGEG